MASRGYAEAPHPDSKYINIVFCFCLRFINVVQIAAVLDAERHAVCGAFGATFALDSPHGPVS